MTIMAVETKRTELPVLINYLKDIFPNALINGFTDPFLAVKYSFNQPVDILFTVIPMKGIDGIAVSEGVRKNNPDVRVYYMADSKQYLELAKSRHMAGYLIRPVTFEAIYEICGDKDTRRVYLDAQRTRSASTKGMD